MSDRVGTPGGRGPKRGTDASVVQRETDVQRSGLLPDRSGIWFSSADNTITESSTTLVMAADTMYFFISHGPSKTVEANQVRVSCIVPGSTVVDSCLYSLEPITGSMVMLNGSLRAIVLQSSGSASSTISPAIDITQSRSMYVFGIRRRSIPVSLDALIPASIGVSRTYSMLLPYTQAIPCSLPVSRINYFVPGAGAGIPSITYLSQNWSTTLQM
jgi:hypothetical protein